MVDRTIFIGDLHGVYDETIELLGKLQLTPNDWVIFLGDYVDRGPQNAKCCDIVREREQVQGRAAGILGNHEHRHLSYEDALSSGRDLPGMPPTHTFTRSQLKQEHYDWFRTLPLYVRVPEHSMVAVHAGCFPGRTIEQQSAHHLLHIQMIRPEFSEKSMWVSRIPEDERDQWKFWTRYWDGPETVVFGHSVLDRPLITERCIGIDGGAVFGHQLHALVMPERKIVSVQAKVDHGKGRRGTQSSSIRMYLIDENVSTYS